MSAGSFLLDSPTRGVLNENFLYGDEPENIEASATSSLGSLSADANSTVQVLASAESNLGTLTASSNSNVTKFAIAASDLGELNSEVNSLVEKISEGFADLGELSSFAVPLTERFVSAEAELGQLIANANASIVTENVALADLGQLTAQAISQVIPPIPPEPPTPSIGNGRADYSRPRLKKKTSIKVFEPEIPIITETEPSTPIFSTITASADTLAFVFSANSKSQIDFSILEDEAELLLLI